MNVFYGVSVALGVVAFILLVMIIVVILLFRNRRKNAPGTSQKEPGHTNEECLRDCRQEERFDDAIALQERALPNKPYDVPNSELRQDGDSTSNPYYKLPVAHPTGECDQYYEILPVQPSKEETA